MLVDGEIVIVLPVACTLGTFVVYYESIKRELKKRSIYECAMMPTVNCQINGFFFGCGGAELL
jgi:hypothetical protein